MTDLLRIAIEQGAERIEAHDEFTQSGIFFQNAQLHATVEKVCAEMVEYLTMQANIDAVMRINGDAARILRTYRKTMKQDT